MITQTYDYKNILDEMNLYFRWSKATYEQTTSILKHYIQIQGITFDELIKEAINDENNNVKIQQRNLKKRLMQYVIYHTKQGRTNNTIRIYLSKIGKIYKYLDIEVPTIPSLPQDPKETYEDIPTKDQIAKAITLSSLKGKALITLLASSGLSRIEVANFTIHDFIEATSQYHNQTNIIAVLRELEGKENIIPTWQFTRQKTQIKGFTFSSPESTIYIIQYLQQVLQKRLLADDDLLFDIKAQEITAILRRLNRTCQFGLTRKHSFLHPHVLRSYFATTLNNEGCDFLSVEFMLGHKIKDVTASYYKANPDKQKQKYERYVKHLCFTMEIKEVTISDDELLELEELREYKQDMDKRLRNLEELLKIS